MQSNSNILRYAAFTTDPEGGNPAGIVLDASALPDAELQEIAAEVGYAETAFVVELAIEGDQRHLRLRYFSPVAEVPFCGHATIATAAVLARRDGVGPFTFETSVGPIFIETTIVDGMCHAAFTSASPQIAEFEPGVLAKLLSLLGITEGDLDPHYHPLVSYAGNWHPVLFFAARDIFDQFTFDPQSARDLMDAQKWPGTITTAFAISDTEFETRNIFPVGRISEDPATGSAAAALGGYLRLRNLVTTPTRVVVHQGRHVGRPSLLSVEIPTIGGIIVSGTAVQIL